MGDKEAVSTMVVNSLVEMGFDPVVAQGATQVVTASLSASTPPDSCASLVEQALQLLVGLDEGYPHTYEQQQQQKQRQQQKPQRQRQPRKKQRQWRRQQQRRRGEPKWKRKRGA
eukprot:TRINITY_DN3587_c3_g1_i1.p2 TRINITY_DN3587_c3_g1~~TRINITY_DN3587_c3_g1_i1.p2  ORF type:complete len:114 (-),score=31.60 TRINITY_DN3587_c3_g1_i1:8-349(-)